MILDVALFDPRVNQIELAFEYLSLLVDRLQACKIKAFGVRRIVHFCVVQFGLIRVVWMISFLVLLLNRLNCLFLQNFVCQIVVGHLSKFEV